MNPKTMLTFRVPLTPGRCRWCGCTEDRACGVGCSWADRAGTLCSECVPLDTAMKSARGRRELAQRVAEFPRQVTDRPHANAAGQRL